MENGGEGGIRTHGTREGTTVFETAPFDHSGTSPRMGRVAVARPRSERAPVYTMAGYLPSLNWPQSERIFAVPAERGGSL